MILRPGLCILIVAMGVAIGSPLYADPQDNPPTTLPNVDRAANRVQLDAIEKSLAKLNDPDPQIRQVAHDALMQLHHADLSLLRDVVSRQPDLAPEQMAALQDVVMQLFLQTDDVPQAPTPGFLGMHWPDTIVANQPANNGAMQIQSITATPGSDLGVIVADRIPGFAAYRALQPGDIILQLVDHPETNMRDRQSFVMTIAKMSAGNPVRMKVARAGRVLDITVVLDPRPDDLNAQNFDQWLAQRRQSALEFWNQQFVPVLHQQSAACLEYQ